MFLESKRQCYIFFDQLKPSAFPKVSCSCSRRPKVCTTCMTRHIETELLKGRWEIKCPLDQTVWTEDDVKQCVVGQTPIHLRIQQLLIRRNREMGLESPTTQRARKVHQERELKSDESYVSTQTKPCPRCKSPIMKDGGCDHMTCRCGTQFSWAIPGTVHLAVRNDY